MATKWRSYDAGFRALAIILVIVTAFSSMLTGYYVIRNYLLYDVKRSDAYYNTVFFEKLVQEKADDLASYVSQFNKNAYEQAEEEGDAMAQTLKAALTAISAELYAHYRAYGYDEDVFNGCDLASTYLERMRALRPGSADRPNESRFYLFYDMVMADAPDGPVFSALDNAFDILIDQNYAFEYVSDRYTGALDAETTSLTEFLGNGRQWESRATHVYAAETTVLPVAESTTPPAEPTTAVAPAQGQPAAISAAQTTTPARLAETTLYPAFDDDVEYDAAEDEEAYDADAGSDAAAEWLGECYFLRTFLMNLIGTTDAAEIEQATLTATYRGDENWTAGARMNDFLSNSLAQYLYYYPETGEYITNIEKYKTNADAQTPLQTADGAVVERMLTDVRGMSDEARWRVTVTPAGTAYNIGNGTDGESSLRNEFFAVERMKTFGADWLPGELYMFENSGEYDADAFSYIKNDFAAAKKNNGLLTLATACGVPVFLLSCAYILACGTKRRVAMDKLYNDWHLVLSAGLSAAAIVPAAYIFYNILVTFARYGYLYYFDSYLYTYEYNWTMGLVELAFPLLCAAAVLILFEYLTSVVRSGRNGRLIRHSFWYAVIAWFVRFVRRQKRRMPQRDVRRFRAVLIGGCVADALGVIAAVLFVGSAMEEIGFLAALLAALFVAALIGLHWLLLREVRGLDAITVAAEKIRQGDYYANIDFTALPYHLRGLASDIIQNRDGIKTAVEQSVKDARMKTALITNVSHDLKTPLTSIVTYADLLKKCEIQDKKAALYVDIINEKADKLKRLIEDLTEASKASTGNIKIEKMKVNLCEMAMQAVGEFSDELEKRQIEPVVNRPETDVVVLADNRQTWRILENLLSNVKKYAMPGTRVYIDVRAAAECGVISIKNVSEQPLNIPAEELTQRFVRGDASRGTEGSGLGLSIAQSLCELQGGAFAVDIDGDLFKVSVSLPVA